MKTKLFYTYLAGPIEKDKEDGGQQWRDKISPLLDASGICVQDPCKTEPLATGMDVIEAQDKFNKWIQSGNYDKFSDKFKLIVDKDIRMVHRSDFLIVHLFPDIPTSGTIHEMAEAWRLGLPIYLIWKGPKSGLPKWPLYLCTSSGGRLFDSTRQLIDFISVAYELKRQSLRILIIQYVKSIFRRLGEKIYNRKLKKIKEQVMQITKPKEEKEKEEKTEKIENKDKKDDKQS